MKDHTSLLAWQLARTVAIECHRLADAHWHPSRSAMFDQLKRAALSVRLNIAEGYSFTNTPTFRRHLSTAYGSAVETGEVLDHAAATGAIPPAEIAGVLELNLRCRKLTLGLLLAAKRNSKKPGPSP